MAAASGLFAACFVLIITALASLVAACPARCHSCLGGVADCSKKSLMTPPQDFPQETQTIVLDNNHLRVLGTDSFQALPQVEVLRLKGNKLRSIKSEAFKMLPNLMTLDLSDNDLTSIDSKGFVGLLNLQTLSLQHNKLRSLARFLDSLPRLYQLNLAFNSLREIGKSDLKTPTEIHYLDLRNNRIQEIHPQAFAHLQLLRYLFLTKNPLVTVPDMTFGSQVLQLVDFSSCRLTHVPKTLPESVSDFRLNDNKITQIIDTDFVNITKLKMLALNNNELHFVANSAFSHLKHLEEVWLRNNKLVYIPRGLPDNLQTLYMDSNRIREIEDGLFTNQSQLQYLTVEMNKISHVGNRTFSGLRYLKSLNFRGNKLQVIEAGTFTSLHNLSMLTLSDNPLQTIQKGAFADLDNLSFLHLVMCGEEMNLQENFLEHMPSLQQLSLMNSPGLAKAFLTMVHDSPLTPLKNLAEMDLSYNELQTLSPNVLEAFPALRALYLDGNPWVCDRRLAWLRDWMHHGQLSFFRQEPPVCEKPYSLKGHEIKEVGPEEFGEVVQATQPVTQEEYDRMMADRQAVEAAQPQIPASKEQALGVQNDVAAEPIWAQLSTDKPTTTSPTTQHALKPVTEKESRKKSSNKKQKTKSDKDRKKQKEQKEKENKKPSDKKKKKNQNTKNKNNSAKAKLQENTNTG